MITINEYRNIMAYFKGFKAEEELTKKELKYINKNMKTWLEITNQINILKEIFNKQNEYEKQENKNEN